MGSERLRAAWLFFIGVIIIIVGFFLFVFMVLDQTYSFGSMLAGLLVSTVGSIYGRRKVALNGFSGPPIDTSSQRISISDLLSGIDQRSPKSEALQQQVIQPVVTQPSSDDSLSSVPPQTIQLPINDKKLKEADNQQMQQTNQVTQQANQQMQQIPAPSTPFYKDFTQKIIKIYICPRCNGENEEKNTFCYQCGKKIRFAPRTKK